MICQVIMYITLHSEMFEGFSFSTSLSTFGIESFSCDDDDGYDYCSHSSGRVMHLIVCLICISIKPKDAEHLFMYICHSYIGEMSKSFAHFFKWYHLNLFISILFLKSFIFLLTYYWHIFDLLEFFILKQDFTLNF